VVQIANAVQTDVCKIGAFARTLLGIQLKNYYGIFDSRSEARAGRPASFVPFAISEGVTT